MRLLRTITVIVFVTLASLTYVHQQVELVKMSYAIECNEKKLKEILDHRERLGYNINHLESPFRLEQTLLSRNIEIGFPKRGHVVSVAKLAPEVRYEERLRAAFFERVFVGFLDLFTPGAEAQAREK